MQVFTEIILIWNFDHPDTSYTDHKLQPRSSQSTRLAIRAARNLCGSQSAWLTIHAARNPRGSQSAWLAIRAARNPRGSQSARLAIRMARNLRGSQSTWLAIRAARNPRGSQSARLAICAARNLCGSQSAPTRSIDLNHTDYLVVSPVIAKPAYLRASRNVGDDSINAPQVEPPYHSSARGDALPTPFTHAAVGGAAHRETTVNIRSIKLITACAGNLLIYIYSWADAMISSVPYNTRIVFGTRHLLNRPTAKMTNKNAVMYGCPTATQTGPTVSAMPVRGDSLPGRLSGSPASSSKPGGGMDRTARGQVICFCSRSTRSRNSSCDTIIRIINDSFLRGWLPRRGKAQMACNLGFPLRKYSK